MKILLLTFYFFATINIGAKSDSISKSIFLKNGYKEAILEELVLFSDSIKHANRLSQFILQVRIKKLDSIQEKLSYVIGYNVYNPFYVFNPTHYLVHNDKLCLIKFDSTIRINDLKTLDFNFIDAEALIFIKQNVAKVEEASGLPTGYGQSLSVSVDGLNIVKKWYRHSDLAPPEDKVIDLDYIIRGSKYEKYLEEMKKKYGY